MQIQVFVLCALCFMTHVLCRLCLVPRASCFVLCALCFVLRASCLVPRAIVPSCPRSSCFVLRARAMCLILPAYHVNVLFKEVKNMTKTNLMNLKNAHSKKAQKAQEYLFETHFNNLSLCETFENTASLYSREYGNCANSFNFFTFAIIEQ